jgi:putative solute:sodium symporter small subunit
MAQAPDDPAQKTDDVGYWKATQKLTFTAVGIWAFFSFFVHFFAPSLNSISIPILKFPLGYYMAAQGSLIVFVALIFWFCNQQEKIDEEFGVSED